MNKINLSFIFYVLMFSLFAGEQPDSTAFLEDIPEESAPVVFDKNAELPSKEYRPELGAGLGYYALFGDVRTTQNRSVYAGSIVYSIYAARRINSSFDFGLRFSTGAMVGNETGPSRYLNFKTVLHEGSAFIAYDFNNFFSKKHVPLQPYLTLGLTVFEFNNKGDLYDANGNYYNYWSDGTIRNIAEGSVNASQAIRIQRDYNYETDLRKANLDGFGRYRQIGFGIPVGLQFEFNITKRTSFRIGSVFTYSLTDLLDNVSENSIGNRQGKKGGDHYLQNKISLHYDLSNLRRKVPAENFEFVDYLALDIEDEDKDGIINEFDTCPFTIKDVNVDDKGCPLDIDADGIPDYIDLENSSVANANVDELGVTYTDNDYLMWYLTFIDSLDVSPEILERIAHQKRQRLPKYRVFLKEFKVGEEVPNEEVKLFMQEKDLKVITIDNEKTIYTAGEYLSIADARQRQNKLIEQGIADAQVIVIDDNEMMSVADWKKLSEKQIKERFKEDYAKLDALDGFYAVLLGNTDAGASSAEKATYLEEEDVLMLDGDRNSMNFVKGPYIDTVAAGQNLLELKERGFRSAKIVKIIGGKVLDLEEENDEKNKRDNADFEQLLVHDGKLVVKVGTINKSTSYEEKQRLSNEPSLIALSNPDKSVDYVFDAPYDEKEQAIQKKQELINKGFENPQLVTVLVDEQKLKLTVEEDLKDKFTILFGTSSSTRTNSELNKILSISDVRNLTTLTSTDDNYVAGKFDSPNAAAVRLKDLINKGFSPTIVKYVNGKVEDIDDASVLSNQEIAKAASNKLASVKTDEAVYRVQLGTFSTAVPFGKFKGIDVLELPLENGLTKYISTGKLSYRDAYILKLKFQEAGFNDAFVVAYKDGDQINIKDLVNDEEFKQVRDELGTGEQLVVKDVRYKVQVGAFKDFSSEHSKLRSYPNVEMEIYGDYKRILTGDFATYQEALKLKEILASKGYPNAFVVAYTGKQRLSLDGVNTNVIKNSEKTPAPIVVDENLHIMVQIGLYKGGIPDAVQQQFNSIEKLTKEVTPEGVVRYLAGDFNDPTAATAYKEELKSKGFEGVFLIAFYKSERIDIKKAIEVFEKGKQ